MGINYFSVARQLKLDSLWSVYQNKNRPDTVRMKAIDEIVWSYIGNDPDSAIVLGEQQVLFARATRLKRYEGIALNTIGVAYLNKGNYPKALSYYLKSLRIRESINDQKGVATCYTNIGIIYRNQSDYSKALSCYLKSLKIYEEIKNKQGIGACYNNIGLVYDMQLNRDKALEYYFKSLEIKKEIGDQHGIGNCYLNIGSIYMIQSKASKALEYYTAALKILKEIGDTQGTSRCYISIAELYAATSDFKRSIQFCDSSLWISRETGEINLECKAYENLAYSYGKLGKYKEAYLSHVKCKQLNDTIFNAENSKQLGDMKTKFEVEKKEAELKVKSEAEQEKLKAIAGEEKKIQQVIIFSVAGVLLLVVVFSLFLLNRFRITQRQKIIIEKQKEQVDKAYESLHEKNKEVMDSINYASRIQRALLPSQKYIVNSLSRLTKKA